MQAGDTLAVQPPGRNLLSDAAAALARGVRFVVHDPALLLSAVLFGILVFLAVFGSVIWPKDPLAVDLDQSLKAPSWDHPMGTDALGRDVFARFNEGARISLAVGAIVVALGALVGGLIGIVSGAIGGSIDNVFMRIMDALLAFPPLILAMAVTVGLGVGLKWATVGIILTTIPYYARLVRADVLRIRSLAFVEAAAALGARRASIMGRHIVPHLITTLSVQGAAVFGYAILAVAALGFVGLGAQIPTPEWGTMITEGLNNVLTGGWWVGVFPGIGVLVAVVALNIVADRSRDILDPRGEYLRVDR
jgi:peptide/nickel transport system permease protein